MNNSKHVFIVDDDEMIRECVIEILNIEGYEVDSAIHGKDAIEKLSAMDLKDLPGCIILDLKMPVMDGQAFLREIHQSYPNSLATIPIIVSSANGNLHQIPELQAAAEWWNKPIELEDISRVAHKYCGEPMMLQ